MTIHNNLSERALRIIALLRKNSLFAGTDEAAQRFAQLLSLLATCQMHDVNPEVWLAGVRLAINEPGLIAEELLPWRNRAGRIRRKRPRPIGRRRWGGRARVGPRQGEKKS